MKNPISIAPVSAVRRVEQPSSPVRSASAKPAAARPPTPDVQPGEERANENYREQALAQTGTTSPDANAHIREKAEPKDQTPPTEKNRRNAANPKAGFDRGDSLSQPDNYHPYNRVENPPANPAQNP